MHFLKGLWATIVRLPRVYSIGGAAVFVVVVLVGGHYATRPAPTPTTPSETSHVSVASVASLSSATGPLSVTGKVTSLNQATILSQTSGQIVSLSRKIGDYVSVGSIIAEFENSAQQATVIQAQGSLDAAQANLAKVSGPTGASGKSTAVNTLLTAYSTLDSAVRGTADTMLSNPDSVNPQFFISSTNAQLPITISNERLALGPIWQRESNRAKTLSQNDDLNAEIATTLDEVRQARSFIDTILQALNTGIPNQNVSQATINADIVSATAARTSLTTALSSLAAAQTSLANNNSGGTSPDVASAQAQVTSAQGTLASARSALEKTIVRSPISGVIVSLAVTQGDFVSAFSQIAEVSNPGALEIDVSVTPDDAKTLSVGGKVTINSTTQGVITSVAPALDPTTGKILVKVGVVGSQRALTDGDTVSVSLARATIKPTTTKPSGTIFIPITAAKITPQGPIVFTVSTSSALQSHAITLGTILGNQVTALSGLTPDMVIVVDARGLSDGQTVVVDTQ